MPLQRAIVMPCPGSPRRNSRDPCRSRPHPSMPLVAPASAASTSTRPSVSMVTIGTRSRTDGRRANSPPRLGALDSKRYDDPSTNEFFMTQPEIEHRTERRSASTRPLRDPRSLDELRVNLGRIFWVGSSRPRGQQLGSEAAARGRTPPFRPLGAALAHGPPPVEGPRLARQGRGGRAGARAPREAPLNAERSSIARVAANRLPSGALSWPTTSGAEGGRDVAESE